jgi:hypothetical protein
MASELVSQSPPFSPIPSPNFLACYVCIDVNFVLFWTRTFASLMSLWNPCFCDTFGYKNKWPLLNIQNIGICLVYRWILLFYRFIVQASK